MIKYKSLAEERPDLLKEWNYDKNNKLGIYPNKVTAGSGIKVWWKCSVCEHEYPARIKYRSKGTGCPECKKKMIGLKNSFPKIGQSLQDKFPELVKEWNYEKNGDLLPSQVKYGSTKKVWWTCPVCGHEWPTTVNHRTRGRGCPECGKKNRGKKYSLPKEGQSLQDKFPELAKEWNYKKNGDLLPSEVRCNSNKKVWWECPVCGHEWPAVINDRTSGTGCPECSADSKTSFPEQAIYYFLDMVFPGEVENRSRELIDEKGFIEADIYLQKKVVIEYDGKYWHKNRQEKDLEKEFRVKALGKKFIRIVEHNENKVIDNCILYNFHKNRSENLNWAIKELFVMLNISSLFVNVSAFRDRILEFSRTNEVKNSLAVVNPELAKEWNYEKNGKLKPTMFTAGSGVNVWWTCPVCKCEYPAMIANRSKGTGCPECGKKSRGKKYSLPKDGESLQDKFPELTKEWNYKKNGDLLPSQVKYGSEKKVWWECSVCKYEWPAIIYSRTKKNKPSGCPECKRKILSLKLSLPKNGESLQDKFPDLAKEWNYRKNLDLLPSQVGYGSNKKVWWICPVCKNEWSAVIANRTGQGNGCPKCGKKRAALLHSTPKYGESLQDKCVDLAKEWNYEKNNGLLPLQFHWVSNKKVWWKCSVCSHEWQAVISSRTKQGTGCPKCSKIQAGKLHSMPKDGQSLQDKFPNLAIEWNYEKNDKLLPSQVTCSSNKKVWWKCSKCGYEWQATVNNRQRLGRGCPNCYRIKNKKTT